jgi:uncharacterized delta-60 repeat protein
VARAQGQRTRTGGRFAGRVCGRFPAARPLRIGAVLAAAMAVGAVFSAAAQAAPGDLDPTFSGDGKQTTNLGFGDSSAAAAVRQPDGKIVVVGRSGAGDFALARYKPNGTLDASFSGDGKQTTDFGFQIDEHASAVALQRNGKIVVVGNGDLGGTGFELARYNPNGSLDKSFSGDGRQTTVFVEFDEATGVAIQGDGKIVAVGRAGDHGLGDFALARYNPNGSLDTSFSGDGKQTTGFKDFDAATGVAIQGDGKIVAVGFTQNFGGGNAFALARYNPNGSLDTSFSGDGKQTTDFGGDFFEGATGVALQGGKIVAVGGGAGDFALARYNPNGSLDTSFSGDGKKTTDFGGTDGAGGAALQANGKIVAVGRGGAGNDFALARYNPNGTLDTSFSGDGKETTDFGGSDQANGVALQGGKIVAAGGGGVRGDFALARYNADGTLDPSFSGDGKQTTAFAGPDAATGVAVQADGKIVAVGQSASGAGNEFALARYNPNGTLDTSFSGDGKQTTDFTGGATGVALQADGKIVAAGRVGSGTTGGDFALARYNPNGSLDTSFSGDGKQTTDFGGAYDGGATAVALQGDGKIVAVGTGGGPPDSDFAIARYRPNGTLDASFSGDGKRMTDFGGFDVATGVALQANGKIVAVGRDGSSDFALARYNANGSLDASFSGDGKQTTDFGGSFDGASGVALQGDGKIVAVGGGGAGDFALARYNPNGSLDTSFSGDGKQTTDFGFFERANGVALQGDGKIVVVGGAALARYNPNGSLDTSFSGDGKQTTDFGATAVALQGDGKIVAVGTGLGADGTSDFALARYLGG